MSALEPVLDFIRTSLRAQDSRPLFVALQGPQGSGKTYLTEHAASVLRNDSLRVATLSIDDLYLPHDGLVSLAKSYPDNGLLHGRGQPGTHDVPLGVHILSSLKCINEAYDHIRIPAFDKSQFSGEGDRVPEENWTAVHPPLDIVILEGWCVGFYPQSREDIVRKISQTPKGLEGLFDMSRYKLENVLQVNELLAQYIEWWDMFDVCVQIKPEESSPYVHIYKWRLEQEHWMKAKNGGRGMSDEQVKSFIDRYIPGYHFFGDGVMHGGVESLTGTQLTPPWARGEGKRGTSRLLRVTIGEKREIVQVEQL